MPNAALVGRDMIILSKPRLLLYKNHNAYHPNYLFIVYNLESSSLILFETGPGHQLIQVSMRETKERTSANNASSDQKLDLGNAHTKN